MLRDTKEFDYDYVHVPKPVPSFNPDVFSRAYVIQTLLSLSIPAAAFPKTPEEFRLLSEHLDEIETSTKQRAKKK